MAATEIFGEDGLRYGRSSRIATVWSCLPPIPMLWIRSLDGDRARADVIAHLVDVHGDRDPEPYALHMRAGDCLELTVLNLLPDGPCPTAMATRGCPRSCR